MTRIVWNWSDLPWRDLFTGEPATEDSDDCVTSVHLSANHQLLVDDAPDGRRLGDPGGPTVYDLRWVRSTDTREAFARPALPAAD